tara:strand:- start:212 stop:823 length:612 start_codon:yes stop_codon:yes gene_type:complete
MGDPKKQRKKYSTPSHPWNKERIENEKKIAKDYGLRKKNEIWKMDSLLRNLQSQAKSIIGSTTKQSEKEKVQLLGKIFKLGYLPKESQVGDILNIQLKDILERRLQTIVVRRKLATTMLGARQIIVHEHIAVNGKKITSPSYIVSIDEEVNTTYSDDSPLKNAKVEETKKEVVAEKVKVSGKPKEENKEGKKQVEAEKKPVEA